MEGVARHAQWWVAQRRKKLTELAHDSHAINPFLWPILMSMHGFASTRELVAFQLAGHLVEGHATGFGKLVDEKILSDVFGTIKLDGKFRATTPPFEQSAYDNVDHLVLRPDGTRDFLSLKAGRWSIQLGQAVQLNRSFQVLVGQRQRGEVEFGRIVVGVFYGRGDALTDKYRIIRGLPTKKAHDIVDLASHVDVLAGREFWSWLNGGLSDTQEWVLEGIQLGQARDAAQHGTLEALLETFVSDFSDQLTDLEVVGEDGLQRIDWRGLLRRING